MPEPTDSVSDTPVRRGLPRRTGVGQAPTDDVAGQPMKTSGVNASSPAPASTGRRAGLPRKGTPEPGGTRTPAADPPAPSSAAPRTGLVAAARPASAAPTRTTTKPNSTPPQDKASEDSAPKAWWIQAAIAVIGLIVLAGILVLLARWLRTLDPVQDFLITYPGESHLPENAPVGFPAWLGWQHFLNAFFIVLIIRTGWQVRTQQRPTATWQRNNDGLLKTKNPPKKISLTLWAHLVLDALWVLNGIVFVCVLFATGQWMRVVPTSWDVFPNAASALLQYLSLNWPAENGWINYNSLQLLAYFTTIFVAAPLAAITGVRMSGAWPAKAEPLNRIYPMELARAIHFPVMLYFTLFVIAHVFLVFSTGALRNLNHMYASQDAVSWTGFWIFVASLIAMAAAVFAARPLIMAPIAQLMGRVGR